jgi:AcrR family transcriptional regulator
MNRLMTASAPLVPPGRPKRADARRNYDRLIAAAAEAFERDGPEASLDGIARAAGVGPGTLYRHFPNRRALLEGVYTERILDLCELGSALAADHEPFEALSLWLRRLAAHTLVYRGLKDVLTADDGDQEGNGPVDFSWCAARMHATCGELLDRVQAGGQATARVKPGDLLRLMHGVVVSSAYLREPERTASTDRLLDLILHGLRS